MVVAVVCIFVYIYRESGIWENPEALREYGGVKAALIIFAVIVCAWAFALPASALLLITPLLFPVHISVPITTAGCTVGAGAGYLVARYVGGWWVERRREGRFRNFLTRHSGFLVMTSLRLMPGVPHGFINYTAGLSSVPFARFVVATAVAMGVKSYVYAAAVSGAVEADSPASAVNAKTILSLVGLAALSIAAHLVIRFRERRSASSGDSGPNRAAGN